MKDFAETLSLSFDKRLAAQPILEEKRSETARLLRALLWKAQLNIDFPSIICLVGGTGTGKSTLFNSMADCKVSEVGFRRPSTLQAVILVSRSLAGQLGGAPFLRSNGAPQATIFPHENPRLVDIVLVDTPDFDSVEPSNRAIADDFFIISDILVFITSQEKYADLTGHEMLARARHWRKKTVFVMNKVVSDTAYNDFKSLVKALGYETEPIRIERLEPPPDFIQGLRNRHSFTELLVGASGESGKATRKKELGLLRERVLASLNDLKSSLEFQVQRVAVANSGIRRILAEVSQGMEAQSDAIVSDDLEVQIRHRLQKPLAQVRHPIRSENGGP